MIVRTNECTRVNWLTFKSMVAGLEYSYGGRRIKYSLSEELTCVSTTPLNANTIITAGKIVEVVGKDTLKQLVEAIWEPSAYIVTVDVTYYKLSSLIYSLRWADLPANIIDLVRHLEERGL